MKDTEELTKEEIIERAESPFKVSREFLEFLEFSEFPNLIEVNEE